MPNCRPTCVDIKEGWSDRQKWNYVKNIYQPNYAIDENGDAADSRDVDDSARIADFETWDGQYNEDHSIWLTYFSNKPFEKWLQWQYEIGTTAYGNLPQHKRHTHTGHCWMPCPYSTDSSDLRSENMWDVRGDPVLTKVDHGDAFMQTDSRGNRWGWTCTYNGCSYLLDTGIRYFYK